MRAFLAIAFLVVFMFMGIGFVTGAYGTEIRFENCENGVWIGGVKWEWKDGIRGNYAGSTYHDVPELELKGAGSLVVDLEPGDYAITYYRPRHQEISPSGKLMISPAAILDFREIEVTDEPATYYFGCED